MNELKLWFSGGTAPELQKTHFSHRLLEDSRRAIRGKTEGAHSGYGTFQWTPAVQALCTLLLRGLARTMSENRSTLENSDSPILEGDVGTPSSSLSFALSKQPAWLIEIFGKDSNNQNLGKRLIKRTNPNRKRSGPVALSLNRPAFEDLSVQFLVDGKLVADPVELETIADRIEQQWRPQRRPQNGSAGYIPLSDRIEVEPKSSSGFVRLPAVKIEPADHFGPAPARFDEMDQPLQKAMRELLRNEIQRNLWKTDIFNPRRVKEAISSLQKHSTYRSLTGARSRNGDTLPVSPIDLNLSSSMRLGRAETEAEISRELNRDEPIRVAFGVVASSIRAIFYYLKYIKGYNIEIYDRFAHSLELLRHAEADDFAVRPDLVPLGVAHAAMLINQGPAAQFRPLMFLPKNSLRIVGPRRDDGKTQPLNHGRYVFISGSPSSEQFYFDDLRERGLIDRQAVNVEHMEPDEAFQALNQGDPDLRAISFFPHYCFNYLYNGCQYLDDPENGMILRETVLFGHTHFLADSNRARCLNIAVRDAWLNLRDGGPDFDSVLDRIVENSDYKKALRRFAGLYNIRALPQSRGMENVTSEQV